MHPDLNLFGHTVKAYRLFALAAACACMLCAFPLLRRAGLPIKKTLALLTLMAVFFLAGARLLNYALNPAAYGGSLRLFSLTFAGFSVYGGILGCLGAVFLFARFAKADAFALLDAMTLPGALAFSLARVGCFLNGCCGGIPTDSPLGVVFPQDRYALIAPFLPILGQREIAVHPTQLYELALALPGLIPFLFLGAGKRRATGVPFLVYALWFTAMRFAVLPLRALPYSAGVTNAFYPAFYAAVLLSCAFLLYRRTRNTSFQSG